MPVSRTLKTAKIPRAGGQDSQDLRSDTDDLSQIKRSPSSPQGGPKKRSAFGDITNAKQNSRMVTRKSSSKKPPTTVSQEGSINTPPPRQKSSGLKILPHNGSEQKEKKSRLGADKEKNIQVPAEPSAVTTAEKEPELQVAAYDDVDEENLNDPFLNALYAKDIFNYMKEREEMFVLKGYMEKQPDLNIEMRAILVDWMVEVQENFELNHETLYLAVKLVDHFLASAVCLKENLQLLGSTAILLAAKFDERCPPCVDDFLYICDDAYQREELLSMEVTILKTLKFDINIPVAYRFLRRYAKCGRVSLETLTLSRYICELTLQEYGFVWETASKLAASCLLLALKMKSLGGWTPTLEHYTGYNVADLQSLIRRLNLLLYNTPNEKLKAVRYKYSHKVFFQVAKIPPVDVLELEEQLSC